MSPHCSPCQHMAPSPDSRRPAAIATAHRAEQVGLHVGLHGAVLSLQM